MKMRDLRACSGVAAGGALVIALLGSCATQPQLVEQAIKVNLTVEESQNKMLVLNVVRAYHRMPMHFTGFSAFRAPLGAGAPSIQGQFQLGRDVVQDVLTLTPSYRPDTPQYDVAVLNAQEFMRGITKPVLPQTVQYYLDQGWPQQFILHLLIREVRVFRQIEGEDGKKKLELAKRYVNYPQNKTDIEAFSKLLANWASCEVSFKSDLTKVGPPISAGSVDLAKVAAAKKEGIIIVPEGGSFQPKQSGEAAFELSDSVNASGDKVDCPGIPVPPMSKTKTKRDVNDPKPLANEAVSIKQACVPTADTPCKAAATAEAKGTAVILLRSPEAVLYYLGEITRAQLTGGWARDNKGEVRDALADEFKDVFKVGYRAPKDKPGDQDLFRLRKGEAPPDAAVVVEYRGEQFWIPGKFEEAGRSMHAISLVTQLIGIHKNETALPSTISTTVRVVP